MEVAERAIAIEGRTNLLFSFEKMAIRDAFRSIRAPACSRWGFVYGAGDAFNPWRGVRQAASTDRYSLDQRSVCQYFKYVYQLAIKVRKQSLGKIQCLDSVCRFSLLRLSEGPRRKSHLPGSHR